MIKLCAKLHTQKTEQASYANHFIVKEGSRRKVYLRVRRPPSIGDCCNKTASNNQCTHIAGLPARTAGPSSWCWKRAAINLAQCEEGVPGQESSEFTTYTKKKDQQCVPAGQQCGCTGCLTQSCCSNHQCLEVSGHGGKLFCVNPPSR